MAAFVVFAAASLGAGFAASGTQLILWRIGSAFLFANSAARITDSTGPIPRPTAGALVAISWQWVFGCFNVPLVLAGATGGWILLRELARPDAVRGFDLAGRGTFVVGLTAFTLAVSGGDLSG